MFDRSPVNHASSNNIIYNANRPAFCLSRRSNWEGQYREALEGESGCRLVCAEDNTCCSNFVTVRDSRIPMCLDEVHGGGSGNYFQNNYFTGELGARIKSSGRNAIVKREVTYKKTDNSTVSACAGCW
jgi:hypothetical protein